MNRRISKLAVRAIVTLTFIGWLVVKVNWKEVWGYFEQFDIWWAAGFVLFYVIGLAISSYKWKMLAEFKGIKEKYLEFFKIYLAGTFINNFFPSIVGGDTYRSYTLGKYADKKYVEATSTVLVDRITGLFGVMLIILIFSLLDISSVMKNPILIVINLLIIAAFGFDFFLMLFRILPIWKYSEKYVPQFMVKLFAELGSFRKNYKVLGKALVWGAIYNFIGVGIANWMLFQDLHISIGFVNFMAIISIISIISSIPVSIGNIGIKEWGYITMFGLFGVNGEAVISIAIFGRILQMLISFFALPTYLESKKQ
jgi:glycosyltransferase 2 family protein